MIQQNKMVEVKLLERLVREGKMDKLDKLRSEALSEQDPVAYFNICNISGVEPEDPFLYQLGEIEIKIDEERINAIITKEENRRYLDFYNEARFFSLTDFGEDVDKKSKLLIKYFPKRFGPNAKQDLTKYSDLQIGSLFKNFTNNSYKIAKKHFPEYF